MPRRSTNVARLKVEHPQHSAQTLLSFYEALLRPRMIEERALTLLRLGRISKWFSGIGQEAIAVGSTLALEHDEYILPLHRNLGVFTTRNVPIDRLFAQFQGKQNGFTKGRDRSFHFGTKAHHIVGMISHLGPQLAVADGIALAHKLRREAKVTVVYSGEGGTSEGDFHEALNVAAVWDLPVIFLIENNGYALSTPTQEQYRCKSLSERARAYGMEGLTIDGNDLLSVYDTVNQIACSLRSSPRPVLIECMTFRMRGHEEASGTKYVPPELFAEWSRKDPILLYEARLLKDGVISEERRKEIRSKIQREVEAAIEVGLSAPEIEAQSNVELIDVYAPSAATETAPASDAASQKRFVDAVSAGLSEGLKRHSNLIVMGQDIAEYGGVFKVTEGFVEEFGKERIRNTPLCESAILGAGLGLSINGYKSVVEMQFADFVSCGVNQIVNNLAKVHYRWGQNADVVVRMPTGGGVGAGPFHSQSTEAWFCHTPGLKVVYPAFPYDAKGLLLSAIEDPGPVMYFEHKKLYRSVKDDIPDGYYTVPIGKARIVEEGEDVAIITYGLGVHWALEFLAANPEISAHLIDLRSLLPFDKETISAAIRRTGRVIILHEATLTAGIGAEIAAYISQNCFEYLDAPVMRSASLDTPVPFCAELEKNFFPLERFAVDIKRLLEY